jgi:hypothetical protein
MTIRPHAADAAADGAGAASSGLDFTTWVLSLRETALVLLGLADADDGVAHEPDREGARMHIAMLEILHEKTRGNLSEDEERLLRTVLYELRVAFLEKPARG